MWLLRGNCYINQGLNYCRSSEAVLWIKHGDDFGDRTSKVIAYLEGNVQLDCTQQSGQIKRVSASASRPGSRGWLGEFYSRLPVRIDVPEVGPKPDVIPAVFNHGMHRRDPFAGQAIQRTQFTEFDGAPAQANPLPLGVRRVRIFRRSAVPFQAEWIPAPDKTTGVAVITGGVNIIIDGLEQFGVIDVSADNIIIWTSGAFDLGASSETLQGEHTPLEIYMEGNIVFRQGERVLYADRMYYDVNDEIGTVLAAEVLTPVPEFGGLARLKADLVRQTGRDRFFAEDGFITTSRLGKPGYRLQASNVDFEDKQSPLLDPLTGIPQVNPATGEAIVQHDRLATSRNNFLFLGPVPIFYWPVFSTNLEDPTLFIRSAQLQNDRVFGVWASVDLDAYQLLGWDNPPAGTDWRISLDGLSERGFGAGTTFNYNRSDFFGMPGPTFGLLDVWGIDDHGRDNLGGERSSLEPEEDFRYRVLGAHRQQLPGDFQLSAELGFISDRNFLEQYYETEWDQRKDQATGVELKRVIDNLSWSITGDVRVNDFFTQTEWLPRLDHFWLGQPLLGDTLTWYEHSQAGFGRLRTASTPTDPVDRAKFRLLPWEESVDGERLVTRQEIDLPLAAGPFKIVPYALGELGHWGEVLDGDDAQRAFGQAGLRVSIPFWAANGALENPLFNLHGLAHKVVFDADVSFADSNRDLSEFPLYDPLDDDSIEHFRRRFAFETFGGSIPLRFDERFYALRSGLQNWVASPSAEIADDLATVRMGVRQRWQTKRGPPGRRRIIDWIVLDTEAVWFPNEDRDNFGEGLGLVDYDLRWHVGDRLTLLSDGGFDFFDDGQSVVTLGAFLSRPPRANWFIGFRSLNGPINSQVVNTSYTYRLSPKWITSAGTSYDLGANGNIGQQFMITRVGESLLASFSFNVDSGKDNVGATFFLQPRFLRNPRIPYVPPAGMFGLE